MKRQDRTKNVTAGKDILGDFAPKFAELNDEVLFGQKRGLLFIWQEKFILINR